jgi:Tol biopolymer transport system component
MYQLQKTSMKTSIVISIIMIFSCFNTNLWAQVPEGKSVVSHLYIYDLKKGGSTLVLKEERHFEAPNWSTDGSFLLINAAGKLEKISTKGENLGILNTGTINKCNNDHGFSFDGKHLFISSAPPNVKGGSSLIYKLPSSGGEPELLTSKAPSYWHGVSPDGNTIVYCAERNGNYDVYAMSSNGREERRLTTSDGLDDGPEYSPDGKYIYFNSFRTGKMQIWRIGADGSSPEQMTFDDASNWFAHINPNNQQAVIISYLEDQAQQHPFGRVVKLRLLDLNNKNLKDLTEPFYGGQGTINVPSWSPDGKKFAYVLYSLIDKK